MQNWTPDLTEFSGAKYAAIAAALSNDIKRGILRPGDRLPSQRELAKQLGIDLTTVTKAYNEVRYAGLIEGGGRRGSFVSGEPATASVTMEAQPLDTGMNLPPEPDGGSLSARMRDGIATILARPGGISIMQYQPAGGSPVDRAAAAAALNARGIETSDESVLVTSGGQNALHGIVGAVLRPGDVIAAGVFTYPGLLAVAHRFGVNVVGVACDAEGILPDSLDAACNAGATALYVVPENDNPTTATMSEGRRRAIAAVAMRHGTLIIEDDAYGQLPESPSLPIAAFAPEQTWHVASLSKTVSPGLRVAWLRAPTVKQAWRLASDIHETAVMAPPLNAALVSLWFNDGGLAALIGEVRAEAIARQQIASRILAEVPFRAQPAGYHLWLPLPPNASSSDIVNLLRPAGLSVVGAEAFAVDRLKVEPVLRVSIGGGLSRQRLERALQFLDASIDQLPRRRAAVI